MAETLVGFSRA